LASFTPAYFSTVPRGRSPGSRQLGGDARIEQPPRPESVVTIENPQIVKSASWKIFSTFASASSRPTGERSPPQGSMISVRKGLDS